VPVNLHDPFEEVRRLAFEHGFTTIGPGDLTPGGEPYGFRYWPGPDGSGHAVYLTPDGDVGHASWGEIQARAAVRARLERLARLREEGVFVRSPAYDRWLCPDGKVGCDFHRGRKLRDRVEHAVDEDPDSPTFGHAIERRTAYDDVGYQWECADCSAALGELDEQLSQVERGVAKLEQREQAAVIERMREEIRSGRVKLLFDPKVGELRFVYG
jgi:hypothetical protein